MTKGLTPPPRVDLNARFPRMDVHKARRRTMDVGLIAPPVQTAPPPPPPPPPAAPSASWSPQGQTYTYSQGANGGAVTLAFSFTWGQGTGSGGPYHVSIAGGASNTYPNAGSVTYSDGVSTNQPQGFYYYQIDGQVRDGSGNFAEVTLSFQLKIV